MNSLHQPNVKVSNSFVLSKENTELKKQIERLTLENTKYQNTIIKLQNKVKYYADTFKLGETSVNNNINERCMNKKEFMQLWNDFGRPDLLNNFIDFENEPIIVYHLIQEMFVIIVQQIEKHEKEVYKNISELLKFEKEVNLDIYRYLKQELKQVLKDFHENIFQLNKGDNNNEINKGSLWFNYEEFFIKYIEFFEKTLPHNESHSKIFYEVIKGPDFIKMLEHVKTIVLFLKFNGMQYNIKIEPYNERVLEIRDNMHNRKMNYVVPFGYSKENTHCIVLMHPPCHNKICSSLYDKNIPLIVFGINSEFIENRLSGEKYVIKNPEPILKEKNVLNSSHNPSYLTGNSDREHNNGMNNRLVDTMNSMDYKGNFLENTISTLRSSTKKQSYSTNKIEVSPDVHKTSVNINNTSNPGFSQQINNQNISTTSGDSNTGFSDFKRNPIFHKSAANFLQNTTKDNSLSNNSLNSNENSHSKKKQKIRYAYPTNQKQHYTKQNTKIEDIKKLLGKDGKIIKGTNGQMIVKVKGKKRENSLQANHNNTNNNTQNNILNNISNTPHTPNNILNNNNFSLNGHNINNGNFIITKSNTINTEENEKVANNKSNIIVNAKNSFISSKKMNNEMISNNSNNSIQTLGQSKISYMKKTPIMGLSNNYKNIIGSGTNMSTNSKKKNIIGYYQHNNYLRKK